MVCDTNKSWFLENFSIGQTVPVRPIKKLIHFIISKCRCFVLNHIRTLREIRFQVVFPREYSYVTMYLSRKWRDKL
jgi:hypothetical protein